MRRSPGKRAGHRRGLSPAGSAGDSAARAAHRDGSRSLQRSRLSTRCCCIGASSCGAAARGVRTVTTPRRAWGPVSVASGSGRCSEVAERHFPGEGGLPRRGGVSPRLALVPEGRLGSLPSSHAHMAVPPVGRTHRRQSQANGRLREKRGDTPPPRPCVLVAGTVTGAVLARRPCGQRGDRRAPGPHQARRPCRSREAAHCAGLRGLRKLIGANRQSP